MRFLRRALVFTLAVCVAIGAAAAAPAGEGNPIVFPRQSTEYAFYPDTIVNILLMGIDFGEEGYWGSGYKKEILNCHTDAVMVFAVNLTKNRIDIVSLPRDSVTIVPGVRGIYKLNGAVNCADTLADGLERTRASVEWLLGGVKIDCWFAVDMNMMFKLGDAIGGVDFEMDMEYFGSSGTKYFKGWQHLDGTGIMDYVRARTNATVESTDLGRTRRQRDMMTAVIRKMIDDKQSLLNVLGVLADPDSGFFTSMTGPQAVGLLALMPTLFSMDAQRFTSYSLVGRYRFAMEYNFTFTDMENRASVIKAVYGFDAAPLRYVSYEHAKFYEDSGFFTIHALNVAREFKETAEAMKASLTGGQKQALETFVAAYLEAVETFQAAADTLDGRDIAAMKSARVEMRDAADALAQSIGYAGELPWGYYSAEWYNDPYTNEYQLDWR